MRFSSKKASEKSRTEKRISEKEEIQKGIASYYSDSFNGRTTSSGETFDNTQMTAAHKTLPFGTVVLVRNLENGKKAAVRINDRGPFVEGRIIDLSRAAAKRLGMLEKGIVEVEIKVIEKP